MCFKLLRIFTLNTEQIITYACCSLLIMVQILAYEGWSDNSILRNSLFGHRILLVNGKFNTVCSFFETKSILLWSERKLSLLLCIENMILAVGVFCTEKKLFYVVIICSYSALILSGFTLFMSYFFPVFFINLVDI